jgi:bifunctional non-homologous end joining protein LigD
MGKPHQTGMEPTGQPNLTETELLQTGEPSPTETEPPSPGIRPLRLPLTPMAPIAEETIPVGEEWGYQLKWDGVRLIAAVRQGRVTLYSRSGRIKNDTYPELVERLRSLPHDCVLDGEAVVFDPDVGRPVFQKVLQRERTGPHGAAAGRRYPVTYVLFDLLELRGAPLLERPFAERDAELRRLFPDRAGDLFVTDTFYDPEPLWEWVLKQQWEGIVSKRLSAPYRPGKQHRDWFKKKIRQTFDVDIVAFTYREGRLASLVMAHRGAFFGKISLGLNMDLRRRLDRYARTHRTDAAAFDRLPGELKGDRIVWLAAPFRAEVQGLEVTAAGLLRHPKIMALHLPDQLREEE